MKLFHRIYSNDGDQPLIILHGLFGYSDNWHTLANRFAGQGHYVIVPDQRNHGRSGHSKIHSYEAMSNDLLELADSLGLPSFNLLGHSMGGKTAMQFSIDHPGRVDKLMIADISPADSSTNIHHHLIDIMMSVDLNTMGSKSDVKAALKDKINNSRVTAFLLKNLFWKDRSTLGWRVNLTTIRENLKEIYREIESPWPYDKPVLFLKGEKSDYISDKTIPQIIELFPNAQIKVIKNGTHWLHNDNPDDFAGAVLQFLGR